jgi:hypothetical protein
LPVLEANTIGRGPSVGAFTRIAPDTIAVLVQLVDRLGQGFRGRSRRPPAILARAEELIEQGLLPLLADTVEKVENRKTQKISQMLIFGQVRRWDAA